MSDHSASQKTAHLLSGARRREQDAWQALYDRFYRDLHRVAEQSLGAKLRRTFCADDLVSETWRRILVRLDELAPEGRGQLLVILLSEARRVAAEWGRKGGEARRSLAERNRLAADVLDETVVLDEPSVSSIVRRSETMHLILAAFDAPSLSREEKLVIRRKLVDGMKHGAIAKELGVSDERVRKHYQHALARLRTILGDLAT